MFSLLTFSLALISIIPSTLSADSQRKVATAWFAGWEANKLPVSEINWAMYTQMTYAFAVTTPDVRLLSLEDSNKEVLPQFVAAAHEHKVNASLSIGGWTGSQWFSNHFASAKNRTAFVTSVVDLVKKYDLDGIDFDWEYPNNEGFGCNTRSPQDSANFLLFLQELRRNRVGSRLVLSAATSILPFNGPSGAPLNDVSGFSKVLDYIAIMNYDVSGGWSPTVGPNAPLYDACAPASHRMGSAASSIKAWAAAGMPRNKIVLGVPSYGHSFNVRKKDAFVKASNVLALYPPFMRTEYSQSAGYNDGCVAATMVAAETPDYQYRDLITIGFLKENGEPGKGMFSRFDNCSQTPFVYDSDKQIMVSFDNPTSFAAKGRFIKENNLRGFAMWDAAGDNNNALVRAIRKSADFN